MSTFHEVIVDYLKFLEANDKASENIGVVDGLIHNECQELREKSKDPLSDDDTASFHETKFSLDLLQKLSFSLRSAKDDSLFRPYLDRLENAGFFQHSKKAHRLQRHINSIIYFVEYIKGKNLNEDRFQGAVKLLIDAQRRTDGGGTDNPGLLEATLGSSTLWDELNTAAMKPSKQITVTKATTASNEGISMISDILKSRALKGPPIQFTFALFSISFLSIFLVAVSNSVRESPYLFRALWLLAFAINVAAVCIPGRMDRIYHEGNHIKPWHTLFEAATWCFSLWSVIYIMEALLTLYVVFCGIPPDLFQLTVPYWLAGNWFQALWCFAFRPEFQYALWVPTACLTLAGITFGMGHYVITQYMEDLPLLPYCAMMLFRLPMGVHTMWLAGATLLTFNSWLAVSQCKKVMQIIGAFASAFLGALMGLTLMVYTNDAVIGIVAVWTLDGLACRALESSYVPQEIASQDIYESLSITESFLSNICKLGSVGVAAMPVLRNIPKLRGK